MFDTAYVGQAPLAIRGTNEGATYLQMNSRRAVTTTEKTPYAQA